MKTKLKKWKTTSSRLILRNTYFMVRRDRVILPNGRLFDYFFTDEGGRAVLILPVNEKGEILLSKEYRHAIKKVIYNSIGGGVKPKETPRQAARRELAEETGFRARLFFPLGTFYCNPSRSGTTFYAFIAQGLQPGRPHPEEAEFIENEFLPAKKIESMIKKGEIKEPYFMAAYLLYKLKCSR